MALAPSLVALAIALLLAEVFLRRFYSGRPKRARKPKIAGSPIFTPAPMPAVLGVPVAEPKVDAPVPAAKSELQTAMDKAKKRTGR